MWSVLADVLGLLGSLVLAIPAYNYRKYLKLIEDIKTIVSNKEETKNSDNDPGPKLISVLNTHLSSWNNIDHNLIMLGISLLALAFSIKIIIQI